MLLNVISFNGTLNRIPKKDETCMSRLVGIVLAELIINRQIFT